MCVYWTKACERSVFIEILWHRQTHKQGEAQDEFCSEAIQVAELKEPNTCHACLYRITHCIYHNPTILYKRRCNV